VAVAVSDPTTIGVNSATLVIEGTHTFTGVRWSRQVPLPLAYASIP